MLLFIENFREHIVVRLSKLDGSTALIINLGKFTDKILIVPILDLEIFVVHFR